MGEVAGLVAFYAVLAAGVALVASGAAAAAWEHTRSVTATGWGRISRQQRTPGVEWSRVAALEHEDATHRGLAVDHTSESLAACDQCRVERNPPGTPPNTAIERTFMRGQPRYTLTVDDRGRRVLDAHPPD